MRPIARVVVVLFALLCCRAAGAAPLTAGDVAIEYRESGGMRLTLAGVPVVRGSSIQLHTPDWKEGYYSSNSSPRKVETSEVARRVTVHHKADKKVKFTATEVWRIVDDKTVEVTVKGTLETDLPAKIEWAIGYLNAFALYGGSYAVGDKPGPAVPVVPLAPQSKDDPAVVKDAAAIHFSTPAGGWQCRVDTPSLSLLDGRLAPQRWWAAETPTLWLGRLNVPVKPGEPFELKATLTFEPANPVPPAPAVTSEARVTRHARAYEPPERPFHVIPKPRRMVLREQRIVLPEEAVIGTNPDSHAAFKQLSDKLNARFGLKTRAAGASEFFPGADEPEVRCLQGSTDAIKPEGYTIRCDTDGIEIRAIDAAGFRYAAHTLLQLARPMPDAQHGAYLSGCEIDDSPSLAFRGVHLFPGKDAMDFHRRLVERLIAPLKFNHVVLECEYTRWDSARGIWVDFSVPKEQVRDYVKMLRESGLEPIPLVQSLGHSAWMFKNGQNLDIVEDPETPAAYDVTNPRTYAFIDAIYEEALELFGKVKYFHIGHDEVTLFGRYPNREESKRWGVTKLFLHDVEHWRQFFGPRSVRIMLWGDMMLAREEIKDGAAFGGTLEEARARRAALPKDAIICDWHYDALKPDDYPSLRIFTESGFTTIACTWFNPMNIYGFAQAARTHGAWGLLQTTWAGYDLDEGALDREFKQFSAYVLAAEYAWSADSKPPDELPWRADEVLLKMLDPRAELAKLQAGFTTTFPGTMRVDVGAIRTAPRIDGFAFGKSERALVLAGALARGEHPLPREVTLQISTRAKHVAFLHATMFPADEGEEVGRYEVRYADGSSERVPLKYGKNIRALDDPRMAREARGAGTGKNDAGLTVTARVLVWTNPHPDKPIESVTFATDHPYASPALSGLSGTSTGGD
jgi:hypothetical protein